MGGFREKMLRLQTEFGIKMVKVQYQQSDKTNIGDWCLSSVRGEWGHKSQHSVGMEILCRKYWNVTAKWSLNIPHSWYLHFLIRPFISSQWRCWWLAGPDSWRCWWLVGPGCWRCWWLHGPDSWRCWWLAGPGCWRCWWLTGPGSWLLVFQGSGSDRWVSTPT